MALKAIKLDFKHVPKSKNNKQYFIYGNRCPTFWLEVVSMRKGLTIYFKYNYFNILRLVCTMYFSGSARVSNKALCKKHEKKQIASIDHAQLNSNVDWQPHGSTCCAVLYADKFSTSSNHRRQTWICNAIIAVVLLLFARERIWGKANLNWIVTKQLTRFNGTQFE